MTGFDNPDVVLVDAYQYDRNLTFKVSLFMIKKKMHHFVPRAYLKSWKINNQIFALNKESLHSFEPTGGNSVGAKNKFYSFEFDETVIGLLNYTFSERAKTEKPGNIFHVMLEFIKMMKDFDYPEKETNLFEDYFELLEINFNKALKAIFKGNAQIISSDASIFDSLVILFFTQQMRTPKMREQLSTLMVEIYANDVALSQKQKDDYIKIWLFIQSLATALEVLEMGCVIKLRFAVGGEKFVTCDAPALLTVGHMTSIRDLSGCIPLSPRYIMELASVGFGAKIFSTGNISNTEVEEVNMKIIKNADQHVYFLTNNHRQKYADRLRINRLGWISQPRI